MKLYAISDLHLGASANRHALAALPSFPEDWLILAGDTGETEEQLRYGLSLLTRRFARVIWVPGNHDLWTIPGRDDDLRGVAKYLRLVAACRDHGVPTPEDPYVGWPGPGGPCTLAPLFTLYDYSFRPPAIPAAAAVAWAAETDVVCSDEFILHPDPYPSRSDWCHARCRYTEARLTQARGAGPLVLINHFPLRRDLIHLPRIPRFSLWCGTERTEEWHWRYPVSAVVYGHLHVRGTQYRDGVRFEEVSLGYPQNWRAERGVAAYLREILPGPANDVPPAPATE
jgi:3',5'-cyclic AMP phosphodiesterase CpdA